MGLDLSMKKVLQISTLLFFCFTILSCNKGKETEGDFGQEYDEADLNKVISKAVQNLDPSKMKKDESVSHIVNLRVENSERFKPMMWDRSTILARSETAETLTFHLKVEEKDMSVEPPEEKTYEDVIEYKKTSPAALTKMYGELAAMNHNGVRMATAAKPTKIKYYNLKDYPLVLDAPEAVSKRPNCIGLQDCKINVHHLEFDEVTWYNDGKVIKVRWTYEISPDVPYLANMTTVCAAQLIDYEGSRVYVRNCRYAVDFNF